MANQFEMTNENMNVKKHSLEEGMFKNAEHPKTMQSMYDSGMKVMNDSDSRTEWHDFAKKYLEKLTKPEPYESGKDLSIYYDEKASQEVKDATLPFAETSFINDQRKLLGIQERSEKPFDIQVLAPENWDDLGLLEKEQWWKETTNSPALFMRRGMEKGEKITPTIFLSKDHAKVLFYSTEDLKDSAKDNNYKMIFGAFEHEYRHTQRKFGSENGELFRFIDEACTNVGGAYGDLRATLHVLGMTSGVFTMKEIKQAYESGSDDNMKEMLGKIRESFGDKGIMLLGSKQSSLHTGDHDGISDMPLVELSLETEEKGNLEKARFMETLLVLRNQKDPAWIDFISKEIQDPLKESRLSLEVLSNYHLYSSFKYADELQTPQLYKMVTVIKQEIEKRKELGEPGF